MTNKRKQRISDLVETLGVSRRSAANVLDAGRPRKTRGSEASASEPFTLGQLLAAVHDLFSENREGSKFTTQVNSLRLSEPYRTGGPIPEVPLVDVTFERTEEGWTFTGSIWFVDGEVYDGLDELDPAWLETKSGRERVHRTLRNEIERKYGTLVPVLKDLRIHGGGRTGEIGKNIVLHVRLTLSHPLYALLRRLDAPTTFSVLTGRVPAGGVSGTVAIAREQSQRLATNPQWYAESGGVKINVTDPEHQLLVAQGAADSGQVQIVRSFKNEQRITFAERCDKCRRWISCGELEREGACVCGHKYRIVFNLPQAKQWTLHDGPCCLDCGKAFRPREWVGPRQPWHPVNDGQMQCDDCYLGGLHTDVKTAGKARGDVQARVLKTKPIVGEPMPTPVADLAALNDADGRYRKAIATELRALSERRRDNS